MQGVLIVGPEGDFSVREHDLLARAAEGGRVMPCGLGPLRLRVETAAVALLSGARLIEQARVERASK